MSRSVIEVVKEGIKEASLEEINAEYIELLKYFFYKICVIDPKRNLTPFYGKYRQVYSCFNNKRENSLLEICIYNNNILEVNHYFNDTSSLARISGFKSGSQNLFLGEYKYTDDLKKTLSTSKTIDYFGDNVVINCNYGNDKIEEKRYTFDDDSKEEFISKTYELFKNKKV